jgi:single-strand DNA-binding protein
VARSLNKAMIIGNVGSDPEIRTVGNGGRVAQFSVATSRRWNDRNGQQQEKTEWHRIVAWDKPFNLVDIVERYLKKGDRVYVEGEIEYRQYQDKDGVTKYTTEIRAREMVLLGGKSEGGDFEQRGGGGGGRSSAPARAAAPRAGGNDYDDFQAPALEDDDDLPF